MKLHTLKPQEGSVKSGKRIARGQGSGMGGTSTRGHKGAKSRSGYSRKIGFEGGQMPLQRRVPKFGFKSRNRVEFKALNVETIIKLVADKGLTKIDFETLLSNGLASKKDKVKVLGHIKPNENGDIASLSSAVEVELHAFSKSAIELIEKAGGKAVTI